MTHLRDVGRGPTVVLLHGWRAGRDDVVSRLPDAAAPVAWAQTLAATAPLASLHIVSGAGHLLALEEAASTADAIARLAALTS